MKRKFSWFTINLVIALIFSALSTAVNAQMLNPVTWAFSSEVNKDGSFELILKATVDEGWKIYGMEIPEGGPIATTVTIEDDSDVEWLSDWKMVGPKKTGMDKIFDMEITTFKKKAILRRTAKISGPLALSGFVEYMACDPTQCTPPTEAEFTFELVPEGSVAPEQTSDPDGGSELLDPVKWNIESEDIGNGEFMLKFNAEIDDGWKVYSQHIPDADIRPVPTSFYFDELPKGVELIGETEQEGEYSEAEEPLFENLLIGWFKHQAVFSQKIKANSKDDISGYLEFMTCDDGRCLPPTQIDFKIDLATGDNIYTDQETGDGVCKDLIIEGAIAKTEPEDNKGYLLIFLLGIGGGFLALLTPCVFPMIPMTVSFFTKTSDRGSGIKNAILYGAAIMGIYGLCGVPFALGMVSSDFLNGIATNPVLNILFFVVFMVFAFSFWGFFELTMPSALANKADSASGKGGLIGILFMAVTLALVSFSCTGPILGTFMVGVLSGSSDPMNVLFVMLGFGFGLGLPFGLFALFPSWLNSLPRAGGWMDSFKKVLGFLEFGLAIKFLSNADLVMQWNLIMRETFLVVWALVCIAIAVFLLGYLKLPHHIPVAKLSPLRVAFVSLFIFSAGYFSYGVVGNNLGLISGFPPPMFYSYKAKNEARLAAKSTSKEVSEVFYDDVIYLVAGDKVTVRDSGEKITGGDEYNGVMQAKYDQEHCPLGIPCYHDYETGLAYANLVNKPLMLDFTGWACVNCRRMEENVWVDPLVKGMLTKDYVLVSLYVDEKKALPKEEQFVSCKFNNTIKTVGNKWSNLQSVNFGANAQPYYVLLGPDEEVLSDPTGYMPSRDKYIKFLQSGLQKFDNAATASAY